MPCGVAWAQQSDSTSVRVKELEEFVVKRRRVGTSGLTGPETGFAVNRTELFRAACCNLGEAFTTNPSVDVDYADPATGARQIKLLGLAGQYVQMMGENLPIYRGAAMPYAFRYIPGPWLKSIRVSKGASTVKNGYEAISGAIDVEYLKPQDDQKVNLNAYMDSEMRMELNADANVHIDKGLNTELLTHYEDRYLEHDSNGDGFLDMPMVRQVNLQNRWNYFGEHYIMHAGIGALDERSRAGQLGQHGGMTITNPYLITLNTRRYDGYMKHAVILNKEHNTNIAFAGNMSKHKLDAAYGFKSYVVDETSAYAQLMFEHEFNEQHSISVGGSYNYDDFIEDIVPEQHTVTNILANEETVGAYAQYTYKLGQKLSVMAGGRMDYSTLYGWFATPRANIRYAPWEWMTVKASIGKGYRTVNGWAEYNYLLASGRTMVVESLKQEQAWNYGGSMEFSIPVGSNNLKLNAEYFYTNFLQQAVVDYDSSPTKLTISNLQGKSYSHTFQVDANYEFPFGLTAMLAYRLNDVKTSYNGVLKEKILTSPFKAMCTLSYKTPLEHWQFDGTFVVNGGGRMPAPYQLPNGDMSWDERFPTFPTLNLQVTRWFRNWSVYIGGENLTNFRQKCPIISADSPWSQAFEPTLVWGPITGAMGYAGIRVTF